MKQKLIIGATVLALLAPAFAGAQEDSRGPKSAPFRALIELKGKMEEKRDLMLGRKASSTSSTTQRMMEKKGELEVRKASSTEKRIGMQQGLAKKMAEHTAKVFNATVERLEKLIERIESRIAKVKADGKDTSVSEGFVAQAKAHLSEAKTSIARFASIDLSADKAKENFSAVKEVAREVKEHIKEAHKALSEAVRALKPGSNGGTATTTASTTASTTQE
jgi:hypothetical protein